jgi:hypothetical protein
VVRLENEAIVFADRHPEEDLLGRLRAANVPVENKANHSVGTALRISAKGQPRRFFEIVLEWWEANRSNGAKVTFRASIGRTIELKDSTLPEVRKFIDSQS